MLTFNNKNLVTTAIPKHLFSARHHAETLAITENLHIKKLHARREYKAYARTAQGSAQDS